jgi:periplasmic protein CpxP/Spy
MCSRMLGKLGDYMKDHPNVTKADIAKELSARRDQICHMA